ncbi:nucleoside/nucleotide kinase family protein [Micromonospora sp. HM5-17]|uniref:nucleoside/nucleotide kinase family protein n=1 Tax=Micromonospora sp. HM5-17 TaxID=2487710 RepID=UPI000F46457E|nr:nucleoside/nucleotide kinase family protein [Micromonospora sp. HM5-17]ROT32332.1 nucleoside/nucleotide kinase family protein [Micromonospora sp. HM5-17]
MSAATDHARAAQPSVPRSDFATLLERARRLADGGRRRLLGITGAPGAGKSTLAEQLVSALAPRAVLVPMDGFHLAEAELKRLGIHDRKGAIDTFDVAGYVTLLRRLRAATEPVVYAPTFRRDLEEAIAGAIRVERDVPLVITEGNYLLVADGEWAEVRGLLDDVWYLAPEEEVRLDRLVRRHIDFGRDSETAAARAHGTDQRNADLVQTTRIRADLVVRGH